MDARLSIVFFVFLGVISEGFSAHNKEKPDHGEMPNAFTEEWTAMYTKWQLNLQSPWILDGNQPESPDYEVRSYLEQWKAICNIPCLDPEQSSHIGYLTLYFYLNGYNFQRKYYKPTYPILLEIDMRDASDPGKSAGMLGVEKEKSSKKLVCPERYSTMFYVPIPLKKYPATAADSSVTTVKQKSETFFVREFENSANHTTEYCEEQKEELRNSLNQNNETHVDDLWYCASYDPGIGTKIPRREVWMKKKEE